MIRLALILTLLASPAQAATFMDRAHCWAYPHHERCRPPVPAPRPVEAPAEPVQAPPVAPPPAPVYVPPPLHLSPPAPPVAAPVVVKPVKAKTRVKSKPKVIPKRKRTARVTTSWWCKLVPAGTTMARIRQEAPKWGVTMTPENVAQAQACLNSKGT